MCLRFVPRAKETTLRSLASVEMWRSAGSGSAGPTVPTVVAGHRRYPEAAGTVTPRFGGDGGHPGQVWKSRVADEFDAYVLVISAGSRGWTTVALDDVFDFLCDLDSQRKGTKVVHVTSCPGVGRADDDACSEGFSCARQYAAESNRKGFVS